MLLPIAARVWPVGRLDRSICWPLSSRCLLLLSCNGNAQTISHTGTTTRRHNHPYTSHCEEMNTNCGGMMEKKELKGKNERILSASHSIAVGVDEQRADSAAPFRCSDRDQRTNTQTAPVAQHHHCDSTAASLQLLEQPAAAAMARSRRRPLGPSALLPSRWSNALRLLSARPSHP